MRKWLVGLLAAALCVSSAWADTVTYTVKSKTAVEVSAGAAPEGATAEYATTANTAGQITADKTATLTLKGFNGATITGLTLSMKSNTSKGKGSLSVTSGDAVIAAIGDSDFNSENWHGAWSTEYVDVKPAVTATAIDGDVVILITGSVNSLYCQSYTVEYELGEPVFSVTFDKENWFKVALGEASSVTAIPKNGVEPYTFAWESDTPELNGGTTDTLEIPATLAEGDYTVLCQVTDDNGEGDVINALIGFTVEAIPVITGDTYTLVGSADDFEEGAEYLIVSYSKDKFASALKNEANGSRIGVEEVKIAEDNTVTTESDAIVWSIQAGGTEGQYVLFNEAKGVYAAGPKSEGNNAQLLSDGSDALAQWTLDFSELPAVAIGSVAYPERQLTRNSTATYEYFATYKGSGTKPYLFKKAGASGLSVTLDKANGFTVDLGTADSITATAKNGVEPYTYAWTSDTPDLNGTGETLAIPATLAEGDYTVQVEVTDAESNKANKQIYFSVVAPAVKYAVNVAIGILNGGVTADKEQAEEGELVTLTSSPDAGYKLGTYLLDGEAITGNTFNMPAHDVLVSAEFIVKPVVAGFTKITSLDELTEGEYVITGAKAAGEEYAMMASVSDGKTAYLQRREAAVELEEDVVTDAEDSIIWTLAQGADGWTIYNEAVGYAGYVAGGNSSGAEAEPSAKSSWTITESDSEGLFLLTNVGDTGRYLLYNASSPRFACYEKTTSGKQLALYKGSSGPAVFSITLDPAKDFEVEQNAEAFVTAIPKHAAEGVVGYAWWIDGTPVDTAGEVLALATAELGPHKVICEATDAAGAKADAHVIYTVVAPAVKYAVNVAIGILNGGVTADKEQAEEGELVTLTASADAGYKLGTFLLDGEAITGNTFNMPAHDVLVSAEFVEKPVVAGFTKIKNLSELTEGEYVITGAKAAGEEYAMKASVSDGKTAYLERRETAVELEDDVVTDAEDSIIWTLAQGENGWTIYNEAVGYAGYVASGNSSGAEAEPSAKSSWTITASETEGLFLLNNVDKEGRYLLYNASSPRFACYTNINSGKHLALYKGSSGPAIAYTGETEKTLPDGAFELVFTLRNYDGDYAWSLVEGEGTLGEGGVYQWTATAAGEYTIKVAAINGELEIAQKTVVLTVKAPVVKYQIECAVGIPNGSVSADKTEAEEGELVTLTAKPADGYKLEHFLVNDIAISANTFPMPAEDVLVSASFVEITGETYTRVESAEDFEEGAEYLIVAFSKDKFTSALKNEASTTRIGVDEVVIAEDNTVTTDSDAIVWQIKAGAKEGQYVLFNEAKGVYAAATKDDNVAQLLDDGTSELAQWTLKFDEALLPKVGIYSVSYPERWLSRNSTAGNAYFATYKGSGTAPYLFKKSGPVSPKITFTGDTTVKLGGSFSLQFALKNYDGAFTWEVASREGGSIDAEGLYTWTPSDAGDVTITVVAKNGELDIASKDVVLTVTEPGPIPGEPALVFGGDKGGTVGTPVNFTVASVNVFSDPAVYPEGFAAPEGSTLTEEGIAYDMPNVSFTPDVAGDYVFNFSSGEVGASDYVAGSVTITVTGEVPINTDTFDSIAFKGGLSGKVSDELAAQYQNVKAQVLVFNAAEHRFDVANELDNEAAWPEMKFTPASKDAIIRLIFVK